MRIYDFIILLLTLAKGDGYLQMAIDGSLPSVIPIEAVSCDKGFILIDLKKVKGEAP